ncbi:SDR family oxidoreductase [bacterium]|nr:MAG: SDR family oxidoreductase [bacterium]
MKQTALVTGASTGIGLEIAKELARKGFDLVLVARSEDKLRELEKLLNPFVGVTVLPFDLAHDDAPQQIFEALEGRRIDLLINNAGFGDYGFFVEADGAKIDEMLHVNIVALTNLTRLFLPGMIERRSGRILNVGSIAAYFPGPLMTTYYATKAFVLSFSEGLANEVLGTGVTVTCLNPGPTTSGFQARASMTKSKPGTAGYMSAKVVAKRGVKSMLRGDVICTPGLFNRFLAIFPRLVPRGAMPVIMRRIQERNPEN